MCTGCIAHCPDLLHLYILNRWLVYGTGVSSVLNTWTCFRGDCCGARLGSSFGLYANISCSSEADSSILFLLGSSNRWVSMNRQYAWQFDYCKHSWQQGTESTWVALVPLVFYVGMQTDCRLDHICNISKPFILVISVAVRILGLILTTLTLIGEFINASPWCFVFRSEWKVFPESTSVPLKSARSDVMELRSSWHVVSACVL